MTTCRCVCPACSAFIRSSVTETSEDFEAWQERCETFLQEHECGDYAVPVDGVESAAQAALFEVE